MPTSEEQNNVFKSKYFKAENTAYTRKALNHRHKLGYTNNIDATLTEKRPGYRTGHIVKIDVDRVGDKGELAEIAHGGLQHENDGAENGMLYRSQRCSLLDCRQTEGRRKSGENEYQCSADTASEFADGRE